MKWTFLDIIGSKIVIIEHPFSIYVIHLPQFYFNMIESNP